MGNGAWGARGFRAPCLSPPLPLGSPVYHSRWPVVKALPVSTEVPIPPGGFAVLGFRDRGEEVCSAEGSGGSVAQQADLVFMLSSLRW